MIFASFGFWDLRDATDESFSFFLLNSVYIPVVLNDYALNSVVHEKELNYLHVMNSKALSLPAQ